MNMVSRVSFFLPRHLSSPRFPPRFPVFPLLSPSRDREDTANEVNLLGETIGFEESGARCNANAGMHLHKYGPPQFAQPSASSSSAASM